MSRDRRRIAVCGKGAIACNALGYLVDVLPLFPEPWDLAAVPVKSDPGADSWEPSLRARSKRDGVGLFDTVDALALEPSDVLFSLQYDRIIRPAQLGGARAYNLHFSPLPRYRGCSPSMWPLRNGETESGVTLHVLAAGIDDGDIVDQQLFAMPPFVTAFDLYGLYHAHGYEVFKRNLQAVLAGSEGRQPQDAGKATYYDRQSIDFAAIDVVDWHAMTASQCVGLIRSLVFEPFQLPRVAGRKVVSAEQVAGNWPGAMRHGDRIGTHSALLACRDGLVRVRFKEDAATP
jgi:methionyl-tRNA formyltransferase